MGNSIIKFKEVFWPIEEIITTTIGEPLIELPCDGTVDIYIDWGDGTPIEHYIGNGPPSHTYVVPGDYRVRVKGTLQYWDSEYNFHPQGIVQEVLNFNGDEIGIVNSINLFYGELNMTRVLNFRSLHFSNLMGAFKGCSSLITINSLDNWALPNIGITYGFIETFDGCISITDPAPELWLTHPLVGHTNCFRNNTARPNYDDIPDDWKGL